jgi:hypothetical protein
METFWPKQYGMSCKCLARLPEALLMEPQEGPLQGVRIRFHRGSLPSPLTGIRFVCSVLQEGIAACAASELPLAGG